MTKTINILFLSILFFTISCTTTRDNKLASIKQNKMQSLVDVNWLKAHHKDPDIVILDASVIVSFNQEGKLNIKNGKDNYDKSHIPHARFADLLGDLSGKDADFKFVMPTPEQFQKAISDLGISNDFRVIIYGSNPSESWAQRVWWMLKWAGHDNVAILDGGLNAWTEAGFPVSDKPVSWEKTDYKLNLNIGLIADRNEVFNAINDKNISIIDALPEAVFNGSYQMYARPGHIKSAINIPAGSLVTESGHYKSTDKLKLLFNSNPKNRVITYCGGGISASSSAFALDRLGYKNVAVYMGSLQEWAADSGNPMSIEGSQ